MSTCVICAKRASAETGYCRSCLLDQYPPVKASTVSTPWLYAKPIKETIELDQKVVNRLALAGAYLAGACTILLVALVIWMN